VDGVNVSSYSMFAGVDLCRRFQRGQGPPLAADAGGIAVETEVWNTLPLTVTSDKIYSQQLLSSIAFTKQSK
jgi:hypothetical protein